MIYKRFPQENKNLKGLKVNEIKLTTYAWYEHFKLWNHFVGNNSKFHTVFESWYIIDSFGFHFKPLLNIDYCVG